MVTPNTQVRLLIDVPFSLSQSHVRAFTSKEEQESFFADKIKWHFLDFSYQREERAIKVPINIDKLYDVNYLMYQNTEYTNKWFYAFVTDLVYINPNTTAVYFELDVYQTWLFDIYWKPSYVEREHCTRWNPDGSPVVNTIDEGLNYGTEYKTVQVRQWTPYDDLFFLVMVCTETMHGGSGQAKEVTPVLNGSPQPLTYYIHPFRLNGTSPTVTLDGTAFGLSSLSDVLKNLYKQSGAVNNVANLYITEYPGFNASYDGSTLALSMSNFDPVTIQDETTSMNTLYVKSLPGYATKSAWIGGKYVGYDSVTESKLLMYPYTLTILTDLKGSQQEIKNEYIYSPDIYLIANGSLGVSNKVGYRVENYQIENVLAESGEVAIQHGIVNNNPNDVPIITDLLSAYLQGNRNQIENQKNTILFNQVTGVAGAAMNLNVLGAAQAAGSGYLQMQGLMAKQQDIDATPSQINKLGGNTAFDYGNGIKGVYVIKKQITVEYQKKLTDFFKMYGYRVNEVKVPNLKTRTSFNYVKTVSANIGGNIPPTDKEQIKSLFDNGVTLWHTNDMGNYGLVNNEL